ncbi:hypothetical protein HYN59_08085 [Flavobacterium album]|uniref:DUF4157 domain-containing protein n=1 Tax=Flavobacterium album TaxID=2175091 RepID=A0A2S1QXF5_9FLAO|nr:hypothetical protein [Flavobacterium album]AWH85086.1 hypothetical protein HYN59_08085 [Flavobacterium album]
MIITSKYLIPKGYAAMALFPFIIVHDQKMRENRVLINHERIHLRQQLELLVIFFYIWYVTEYLFNRLRYKDAKKAYRNISFEREAYANEKKPDYLTARSLWEFRKYFSSK